MHCGSCSQARIQDGVVQYFPEAGNLNDSNADMSFVVAGLSSSGSGDLFALADRTNTAYVYYSPNTNSTTGRHLVFERFDNYHTAFRGMLCHHA